MQCVAHDLWGKTFIVWVHSLQWCLNDNITYFLQHQSKHWLFCGNIITSSWFRCSLHSYFWVRLYSVFTCTFSKIFLPFDLLPFVCYSCRWSPLITYAGAQSTGVCPKQHAALWRRRGCLPSGRATSLAKCCLLCMVLYRYCAFAATIENVTSDVSAISLCRSSLNDLGLIPVRSREVFLYHSILTAGSELYQEFRLFLLWTKAGRVFM